MQIKDKTTIRMGFSPCPNDTFILDALVNGKISVPENLNFEWIIEDVEQLNRMAINEALDVTKLSFGVVPLILETYQLLNAGSALGKACGPLLIYKENPKDFEKARVGIPGWHTTAHFLLKRNIFIICFLDDYWKSIWWLPIELLFWVQIAGTKLVFLL